MIESKLPYYSQETGESCLPACLRMVLASYEEHFTEKHLRDLCNCQPGMGTLSSDVVRAARSLGFTNSAETYDWRLLDLRDVIRSGIFPIVGVNLYQLRGTWSPHAQVVVKVTVRSVDVHDPLLGRMCLMARTFERAWEIEDFLTILVEK